MIAIEKINPFRYRGYYYDTETGFYYLQTRYYDPTICRFINADNYALADGLISYGLGKLSIMSGVTNGRNSMAAVYKAGLTKLRNGTAKRMSINVAMKGGIANIVGSLPLDIYYGFKQYAYNPIKNWMVGD